jgi:hypothetical protein
MAIRYGYAAWKAVDANVIQNCFRKSEFMVPDDDAYDNDDDDDDDDVPLAELMERYQESLPLAML